MNTDSILQLKERDSTTPLWGEDSENLTWHIDPKTTCLIIENKNAFKYCDTDSAILEETVDNI